MAAKDQRTHMKRLIVCCDGTWVNSDNGWVRDSWLPWNTKGHLATPSNVTRLTRALLPESKEGIQQICYYQGGLGSANNFFSFFFGGYFGDGIGENIREAYAFLCNNYEDGDEIVLTGFSRGAFTARSVGGLIAQVGLLTKKGLGTFYPVFQDWEHQEDPAYKPLYESTYWPLKDRPAFKDPKYLEGLVSRGLTRSGIPVKAIAVEDTVGSLGVPAMKIFGLNFFHQARKEYSFVNTSVAWNVEHAYQALALDEKRRPFGPTIWEVPDPRHSSLQAMKQTWFPGVHSHIGGGYQDTSISDITLAWMVTQLSNHLDFDQEYVLNQRKQNEQFYVNKGVPVRPWAMGLLQTSAGGPINAATGYTVRTPGQYCATNPETGYPIMVVDDKTGKKIPRKLYNTKEFIHPSVRYRIEQKGPALTSSPTDDSKAGTYAPEALKGWRFVPSEEDNEELGGKRWKDYGKWVLDKGQDGEPVYIVEENIEPGSAEDVLLTSWQGVEGKLYPKGRDSD